MAEVANQLPNSILDSIEQGGGNSADLEQLEQFAHELESQPQWLEEPNALNRVNHIIEPIMRDPNHPAHQIFITHLAHKKFLRKAFIFEMASNPNHDFAAPFIRTSPVLGPNELKAIIELGIIGHNFVICERFSLPFEIVNLLLDQGEVVLAIAMLCNPNLRFHSKHIERMMELFESHVLFKKAIETRFNSGVDKAFCRIIDQIHHGPLPEMASDLDPQITRSFMAGKLPPERILAAAILGDVEALIQLFALYGSNSTANVTELLYNEKNGLKILYSSAGLKREFFDLFKAAWIHGWSNQGPSNRDEQRAYLFERLSTLIEEHPKLLDHFEIKGATDLNHHFNAQCTSPVLRYLNPSLS